jgi:hypothetical protein
MIARDSLNRGQACHLRDLVLGQQEPEFLLDRDDEFDVQARSSDPQAGIATPEGSSPRQDALIPWSRRRIVPR